VQPRAAALLGTSDLDPEEEAALARNPILHQSAQELAPGLIAEELAARRDAAAAWYLHIDVDVAGTEAIPGGMTPAPHPPALDTLTQAIAAAARAVEPQVVGLATYDPHGDPTGRGARAGIQLLLAALARA
jgi:arginase